MVAACHPPRTTDDITSVWVIDPDPPRAGTQVHVILTLHDADGEPVRDATLQMAAHMDHPGMAPVVADATETVPGSYAIDLQLTMGGDWTVVASGALADGRRLTRSVDLKNVR